MIPIFTTNMFRVPGTVSLLLLCQLIGAAFILDDGLVLLNEVALPSGFLPEIPWSPQSDLCEPGFESPGQAQEFTTDPPTAETCGVNNATYAFCGSGNCIQYQLEGEPPSPVQTEPNATMRSRARLLQVPYLA